MLPNFYGKATYRKTNLRITIKMSRFALINPQQHVLSRNGLLNKNIFKMAKKIKIAESRARYFTRKIASEKGWNINHPSKGGDFLEEQEISSYLPDTGLGMSRPDFLLCLKFAA